MKRILAPSLVMLCLLFLPTRERTLADEPVAIDLSALKWKLLQPTVAKTDLGGKLPEVVVMTLTNAQFQKINGKPDDARAYLNQQGIFKRELLKVVFCNVQPNSKGANWILIVSHTYVSTAFIVAWQINTEDA